MTVQLNWNKRSHVLVNDVSVVLCDACGFLHLVCDVLKTFASLLSSSRAVIDHKIDPLWCSACAFVKWLGPVRSIPRFPVCTFLIAARVVCSADTSSRRTVRDQILTGGSPFLLLRRVKKYSFRLDALITMLSIADEQVCKKKRQIPQGTRTFISARKDSFHWARFKKDRSRPVLGIQRTRTWVESSRPASFLWRWRPTKTVRWTHWCDRHKLLREGKYLIEFQTRAMPRPSQICLPRFPESSLRWSGSPDAWSGRLSRWLTPQAHP